VVNRKTRQLEELAPTASVGVRPARTYRSVKQSNLAHYLVVTVPNHPDGK